MLKILDAKLMGFFTSFSHKFQRMTGKTNFFIAKIIAWLIASACFVEIINFFHRILLRETNLLSCIFFIIITIIFLRYSYKCKQSEENVFSGTKTKIFFLSHYIIRTILFLATCSSIPAIFINISRAPIPILQFYREFYLIGFPFFLYFIEINPLPPAKSKVKKFIELILSFLKRKPVAVEG